MEDRLRLETAAREAAEREIAELQAEKRQLEHRVITANRTLAYGLGRAIIEARSLKGLAALPGKIRRLRLKQKVKRRERVPDTLPTGIAERLRLVDPALEKARSGSVEDAAAWVRTQSADDATKGRALAELAIVAGARNPTVAATLASEVRDLNRSEGRLAALEELARSDAMEKPSEDEIATAAIEFGLEGEGKAIVAVMSSADAAHIEKLLATFGELRASEASLQLAVMGGGTAVHQLAERSKSAGLSEYITFIGEPVPSRWPALLGCFDAAIFLGPPDDVPASEVRKLQSLAIEHGSPCFVAQNAGSGEACADPGDICHLPENEVWAPFISSAINSN